MLFRWKDRVEFNVVVVGSAWQEDTDDADISAEGQSISAIIIY
jgi:hypothetical protein